MNPPSERRIYQGSVQPRNFPPLPKGWVSEWQTFPSSDGALQLYSVTHHPEPKKWKGHRTLVILHGLGEHGGRYLHFPHFIQELNPSSSESLGEALPEPLIDAVYCLDHRGHGRSEGLRGHVESFDRFTDDVALAVSRLHEDLMKRFGHAEIHVLGHSMGGLILLRTLFLHPTLPFRSATVSAPLLKIKAEVPRIKKAAALVLSHIWGSLHMTSDLDPQKLSHDPDVVEAYITDRLVHKKLTPRFFTELLSAMADTVKRDSGIELPLQMMVPLQDVIVDPDTSLQFFRALKHRDKVLKTYPSLFHEPFNEIGKEQVFADLISWITSH